MTKLWSHAAAQALSQLPSGSPEWLDLQEALSWRYGGRSLIILPLSSGHWAIFKRDFQALAITDELPTAEEFRQMSRESHDETRAKASVLREAPTGSAKSTTMKAEDLF